MKKVIRVSHYELQPKSALNSRVSKATPRKGFLIEVDGGYADCHPWPEFGDEPVDLQIKALQNGQLTQLLARSLYFAGLDAEARREGRSLFSGLTIPESHFLCQGLLSAERSFENQVGEALTQGFKKLKIKVGHDLPAEARRLKGLFKDGPSSVKIRFDFNSTATPEGLGYFLGALGEDFVDRIDFIEDPFPFNEAAWSDFSKKYFLRLALDEELLPARVSLESFETCVVKSAKLSAIEVADLAVSHLKRVVVTSMMDHPLGQLAAAFEAASVAQKHPAVLDECGLLTHTLFESNSFSEQLGRRGSCLIAPAGAGFGFQEELEGLSWTQLS